MSDNPNRREFLTATAGLGLALSAGALAAKKLPSGQASTRLPAPRGLCHPAARHRPHRLCRCRSPGWEVMSRTSCASTEWRSPRSVTSTNPRAQEVRAVDRR